MVLVSGGLFGILNLNLQPYGPVRGATAAQLVWRVVM